MRAWALGSARAEHAVQRCKGYPGLAPAALASALALPLAIAARWPVPPPASALQQLRQGATTLRQTAPSADYIPYEFHRAGLPCAGRSGTLCTADAACCAERSWCRGALGCRLDVYRFCATRGKECDVPGLRADAALLFKPLLLGVCAAGVWPGLSTMFATDLMAGPSLVAPAGGSAGALLPLLGCGRCSQALLTALRPS